MINLDDDATFSFISESSSQEVIQVIDLNQFQGSKFKLGKICLNGFELSTLRRRTFGPILSYFTSKVIPK